jgi:hypothetical protein
MRNCAESLNLKVGIASVVDGDEFFEELATLRKCSQLQVPTTEGAKRTESALPTSTVSSKTWRVLSIAFRIGAAVGSRASRTQTTTRATTSESLTRRGLEREKNVVSLNTTESLKNSAHRVPAMPWTTLNILTTATFCSAYKISRPPGCGVLAFSLSRSIAPLLPTLGSTSSSFFAPSLSNSKKKSLAERSDDDGAEEAEVARVAWTMIRLRSARERSASSGEVDGWQTGWKGRSQPSITLREEERGGTH